MVLTRIELKKHYDDILSGKIQGFNKNVFSDEENVKSLLTLFVEKLFKDKVISGVEQIPEVVDIKLYKKYKLFHLIVQNFRGSPTEAMMYLYPNKWRIWDFHCHLPNNFFDDRNNIIIVVRDLVINKLRYSYDNIFNITQQDFKDYRLSSILNIYSYNIPKLLQDAFPEYYLPIWKFKKVPSGYWDSKENRINALRELIESLNITIEEIPKLITPEFFHSNYAKFGNVCKKYYSNNLYSWVNDVFPNRFTLENFIEFRGSDGTKLASREELQVHELLLNTYENVKYFENTNDKSVKMYNEKFNESYVPDWILNENIIVEYFGLYDPKRQTNLSMKYNARTKRKIEFYQKYCNENSSYLFIALYPKDLKDDLQGIKEKLNIA